MIPLYDIVHDLAKDSPYADVYVDGESKGSLRYGMTETSWDPVRLATSKISLAEVKSIELTTAYGESRRQSLTMQILTDKQPDMLIKIMGTIDPKNGPAYVATFLTAYALIWLFLAYGIWNVSKIAWYVTMVCLILGLVGEVFTGIGGQAGSRQGLAMIVLIAICLLDCIVLYCLYNGRKVFGIGSHRIT